MKSIKQKQNIVHVWDILRKLFQMIILEWVRACPIPNKHIDHVGPGHPFKHDNYLSFEHLQQSRIAKVTQQWKTPEVLHKSERAFYDLKTFHLEVNDLQLQLKMYHLIYSLSSYCLSKQCKAYKAIFQWWAIFKKPWISGGGLIIEFIVWP